jgi:uncharacterized SAM-binding protein YcdF (DUF218 family)
VPTRLVVVLGYSERGHARLHPVCAGRLALAAEIAREDDVVVLSGWARVSGSTAEAELMRDAWTGSAADVVADPTARTTVENAWNARDDVRRSGAEQVIVVTSRWHAPRARAAFRAALKGLDARVEVVSPPAANARASLRELPLWLLLPFQLAAARRRNRMTSG